MIKLHTLFNEALENDNEETLSDDTNTIANRKKWVKKITAQEIEKFIKSFDEKKAKKIRDEIAFEIKEAEKDNLATAIATAKSKEEKTGEKTKEKDLLVWPVDVEEISLEVLKRYADDKPDANKILTGLEAKLLTIIYAFTQRGVPELKARMFIHELRDIPNGYNLLFSIYDYIESFPTNNIKDLVGQDMSYDKLIEILNKVSKNTLLKSEFNELLDIDRGRTFLTLLFSDITYASGHVNYVTVGNENLVIRNDHARLLVSNDQSGPLFVKTIIDGFNELKAKYKLDILIPSIENEYNISPKNKSWLVDKLGWELVDRYKVSREEVILVIKNAFTKLYPSQKNFSYLEKFVLPQIAAGKTFNYYRFIETYFDFALREYVLANEVTYIMFLNNKLEKFYILDSRNKEALNNMKNKVNLTIPKYDKAALLLGWNFGCALK